MEAGANRYLAQSLSTSLVIEQMCYIHAKATDYTQNRATLDMLARIFGLYADNKTFNTDFMRSKLA